MREHSPDHTKNKEQADVPHNELLDANKKVTGEQNWKERESNCDSVYECVFPGEQKRYEP